MHEKQPTASRLHQITIHHIISFTREHQRKGTHSVQDPTKGRGRREAQLKKRGDEGPFSGPMEVRGSLARQSPPEAPGSPSHPLPSLLCSSLLHPSSSLLRRLEVVVGHSRMKRENVISINVLMPRHNCNCYQVYVSNRYFSNDQ